MTEQRITNEKTGGEKGSKEARFDLIPPYPLEQIARVFGKGCQKYAARNWEKGYDWGLSFAAMQRHAWAFWSGEETDPESGLPHLAHAAWHCLALMQFCQNHRDLDDRSKLPSCRAYPGTGSSRTIFEGLDRMIVEDGLRVLSEVYAHDVPDGTMIPCHSPTNCCGAPDGVCTRLPRVPPPTFYVAGPMRGVEKFNFPAFDAARDLGRSKGYRIISPADMDREHDFDEEKATQESVSGPEAAREFAKRDTEALLSLRAENGDGIAMLPGWERSTGAAAEFMLARWLGLKIVDAETFEPLKPRGNFNGIALTMEIRRYLKGQL